MSIIEEKKNAASDTNDQQGDVEKVIRSWDQTIVASYAYDAWGNPIEWSGPMAERNPIRYRGYYYDTETGFYYLQSRYYDPQTGRFINADGAITTGQGLMSYNMFAYCLDNPVNGVDYKGTDVYGFGYCGNIGAGAGASEGQYVIWDDEENEAVIISGNVGGATPSIGCSIIVVFKSNADNVFEFVNSKTVSVGGSCWLFGVGYSTGINKKGEQISTFSLSFSVDLAPASLNAGIEHSRFIELSRYKGKQVPHNVDSSFFSDLEYSYLRMIQKQLKIRPYYGSGGMGNRLLDLY